MAIRVLIADDHAIMREGLRAILATNPDLEVIGEAGTGRQAVEVAAARMPEIVIMDVTMPDLNGIEATRRILAAHSRTKVIALSAYAEKQFVLAMLEVGASGYVVKVDASTELLRAIEAVHRGRKYLCSQVADAVVDSYLARQGGGEVSATQAELSSREREIVQLVAEGRSSREIAEALHLSIKTVETHRRNVMARLNLHSVADLVKYAVRHGLTSLDG